VGQHNEEWSVVAPGIAEALLATAIGLVAAIPAVVVYNLFARSIAGYRALLSDASAAVLRHVSRDLEKRQNGIANFDALPEAAEPALPFGATLRPAE
jgi:biopolymer transport protein ExbB